MAYSNFHSNQQTMLYHPNVPAVPYGQSFWPNNTFPYQEQTHGMGGAVPLADLNGPSSTHPILTHSKPQNAVIKQSRRCMDYGVTVTLILVWGFLLLNSMMLLGITYVATRPNSDAGDKATTEEIGVIIFSSSLPALFATILNEVLIDQCWRRVVYSALGDQIHTLSDEQLARNLLAANFEWLNFIKRLFTRRVSGRDVRSMTSYGILRWGTAISIASVQLCVSWKASGTDPELFQYAIKKRYVWLVGPLLLHACSVFGAMLVWMMPPWTFFSDRFNDHGLLRKYTPYLERVPGGSIARYNDVAKYLEMRQSPQNPLTKRHEPGRQFKAKIKGIWFGLLTMYIPPVLAGVALRSYSHRDILAIGTYRFIFHFVFLAQNIFYIQALDFVVWNISLEGFCKRVGARPNKTLRHLGYSSGIILFSKAVRQRKPVRAIFFIWLFWIQASLIRLLTALYTISFSVVTYGSYKDRIVLYDPTFWAGWVVMTTLFVFPPFLIWLVTTSEAPISEQDGWRWAKIAQYAMNGPGFYGVRDGQAVWGVDVEPFKVWAGRELR